VVDSLKVCYNVVSLRLSLFSYFLFLISNNMSEPTYRQALSHAWQLTWHHPVLWIFGLLAVLTGQFGLNNFVGKFFLRGADIAGARGLVWWKHAAVQFSAGPLWSAWLIIILLSVLFLVVVVSVGAKGALIAGSAEFYKKNAKLKMAKIWDKGIKHFWRLIAVVLVEKLILGTILFLMLHSLLFLVETPGTGFFIATILVTAAGLILALAVVAVTIYTLGYIVVDGKSVPVSVAKAWKLFSHHVLVSLETSLILLLFTVLLFVVIIVVSQIFLIPILLLSLVGGAVASPAVIYVGHGISLLLLLFFIAWLGAVFNTFTVSTWMYLFLKMHHEGVSSRVMGFLGRALGRK